MRTETLIRSIGGVALIGAVIAGGTFVLKQETKAACSEPIRYRLGEVDERFGISESELRATLESAAEVWNKAGGKTLLVYDPEGELPVHLRYDVRQATAELGGVIDVDQQAYDEKSAEIDALISAHETDSANYERRAASFERANRAYEEEVREWNEKGGAPPEEYEQLEEERMRLARMQAALNSEAGELNAAASAINREVERLNALADVVNRKVGTYNTVAGKDFDQGKYVEDANGKRINIYEFKTRFQLERALAHEFGHVLGIGHTENPQSLMYSYNNGKTLVLHTEDLAALKEVCGTE